MQRAFELFMAGEFAAGRHLFAPDVVVTEDSELPNGSTYAGRDGVYRWAIDEVGQLEGLDDVRFEIEHMIASGENVIVLITMLARHIATGAKVELEYAQVWTIRGGAVSAIQVHLDRTNALASARVVEEASPGEPDPGQDT